MDILLIVDNPRDWPLQVPGATLLAARTYLIDPTYSVAHSVRVFNLCKSYRYQSMGYYVSLLAEARGHKPLPKVGTIEDLQSPSLVRSLTEDLDTLVQRLLAPLKSDDFELSIYFGRNVTTRYDQLSHQLFKHQV